MANWIKSGDKHPGLFKKKAEAAGMSTRAYAEKEKDAPGKLGEQARFAKNAIAQQPKRRGLPYKSRKG